MPNLNRVFLIGNLTRDPELRYTPKGLAIARLGLAVNRTWKDAETGETKEEVTFVDIDSFGRQAETLAQYVKKGRPLFVEGRLRLDTWDDKTTGQKRSKLNVVLESFQFLDSGKGENRMPAEGTSAPPDAARNRPAAAAAPAPAAAAAMPSSAPEPDAGSAEDDDVPF